MELQYIDYFCPESLLIKPRIDMGTEGIQDKYINPYADFGFKLLFGTAMNKELFEAAGIAKSILRN